jgi:maleylacetate reductase
MSAAVFKPNPVRVFFGADCLDALAGEAARLGMSRSVVMCSPSRTGVADALARRLAPGEAVVCDAARPNFPESAFDAAMKVVEDLGATGLVAVGGGTPIGLGKSVAAESRLPLIAVATTYSGSEHTARWYVGRGTANGRGGNEAHALPRSVLYDPRLTLDLPPHVSAASGMNAMAHAVESLYGADLDPAVAVMAREAVRLLAGSLPRIVERPDDLAARSDALKGAWFAAGFRARTGLSHIMAQRIRGAFDLDHGETHAVTLPYAVAFNAPAAAEAMTVIAGALGAADAAQGLYDLNRRLRLATGYHDLGVKREDIDLAVERVAAAEITYPRPASREDIRRVVEAAWAGDPPAGL